MLSSDPVPETTELVFEFLERLESSREAPSAVLDALCEAWPSRAASLRDAVGNLAGTGLMSGRGEPANDADATRVGPYRLGRRLGSGGMGVVYLAWKDCDERAVALKLLRPDVRTDHDATSRFDREIEVAARLDHPNIVRVLDRGALPVSTEGDLADGQRYLAMEYHAGGTLERVTGAFAGADAPPSSASDLFSALGVEVDALQVPRSLRGAWWEVVLRVTREIARALAHAHARGVVHRDVKPSNVLVTPEGRVLLLDFGLAMLRGSGRLTVTGVQLGSLPYMSPEQVRGESTSDERTDVYSLAVTAYELLTLDLPYRGENPERLGLAISRGGAARPSQKVPGLPHEVAAGLDAVLGCAMDVDPRRRYASAEAFAADLTAVLDHRPPVARPPTTLVRTARWVRRRPFVAATVVLASLVAIGGPVGYGVVTRRHATAMEHNLDATLGHVSSLIEAVDGQIRGLADGPLKDDPLLIEARLTSTEGALGILDDVRRDGAEFLESDDPRAVRLTRRLRRAHARLNLTRGDTLYDLHEIDAALDAYREQETACRALLESDAEDLRVRLELGVGLIHQARAIHRRGTRDPAFDVIEEGIEWMESAQQPGDDNALIASNLVSANLVRATALDWLGRGAEARSTLERAVELATPLAEDPSARPVDRRRLGEALVQLAHHELNLLEAELRSELLGRARIELEAVLDEDPRDSLARVFSSDVDLARAYDLFRARRHAEALERVAAARVPIEQLLQERPDDPAYLQRLRQIDDLGAYLSIQTGDILDGVDSMRLAEATARAAALAAPDAHWKAIEHARCLSNLANQLMMIDALGPSRLVEAEEFATEGITILEGLDESLWPAPAVAFHRIMIYTRAVARARAGDLAGCARDLARLEALTAQDDANALRFLADAQCEQHLALVADGAPEDALGATRETALTTLERAVDAGFADAVELRTTPALDPLRDEPRFRALLERL